MKRLIIFSIALFALSFFTTTVLGQNRNTVKDQNQFNTMMKFNNGKLGSSRWVNWIDADGDGICDNYGTVNQGSGQGRGYGLKDGSGMGIRPQNGSGFGRKGGAGVNIQVNSNGSGIGFGTGVCDGTGPKGNTGRRGRRSN